MVAPGPINCDPLHVRPSVLRASACDEQAIVCWGWGRKKRGMAGGVGRHGKAPAAAEADEFPVGMRVLAVDNDRMYLRALESLLRHCSYQPTMVMHARTALEILRAGADQFDLVIMDVHMPDMDGFKLLEIITVEMDLPAILLSADGDNATMNRGILHGACAYLVKPVRFMELKKIWQHVVRKNLSPMNPNSSDDDDDDDDQREVQPEIVEGKRGGEKGKKFSKKNKNEGGGSDKNKERMHVRTRQMKPRVSWTDELHCRFLKAVYQLGIENAYPKAIWQLMKVDYVTRGSVASHLQNYRLKLKRAKDEQRKFNLLRKSSARRKSSSGINMNHQGGPEGVPIQSRNWATEPVGHGGSIVRNTVPWVPDTTRHHASGPQVNSLAKVPDHTMFDAFSSSQYDKEYANFLRENLLEASNVGTSSHPAGNCFATMPNSGVLEHVNQFPVQPPELLCKNSMIGAHGNAQFPCHIGTTHNPWQHLGSSNFPGQMDGTPLFQPSQLLSSEASPARVPMFQDEQQNQMVGTINNTTLLNQMAVKMTSLNFAPTTQMVNSGSTSSLLPNLHTGSSVAPPTGSINFALPDLQDNSAAPTQMLNGGDASGIVHDLVDQETPQDQPNYNNPFFLDEFFATMCNEDFSDDVFRGGEY